MRILHTSDWHLGHTLHGLSREREHSAFLRWLLALMETEAPDALLLTGDVFDSACPPVSAERAFFDFLADARLRLPDLDVVVIGGNHDSAIRLEAPAAILAAVNVRIVGSLRRRAKEPLNTDRLVLPLHNKDGSVGAWVAAVPFLRPVDLPPANGDDPLVAGVRTVYEETLAAARARREPNQALLATGHCYMVDTRLSELSERKILGGNQHALPVDIFADDLAYVALGHLHRAQAVGGCEQVRYAGSPIPLSLAEVDYVHEVRILELEGERLVRNAPVVIPRTVDLQRIPTDAPAELEVVLPQLLALPPAPVDHDPTRAPFLEVRVLLEHPEPGLRRRVEEALEGRWARLVKLSVTQVGEGEALADDVTGARLGELDPRDVFLRCYRREHEGHPPPKLLEAFDSLLAEVSSSGEPLSPVAELHEAGEEAA